MAKLKGKRKRTLEKTPPESPPESPSIKDESDDDDDYEDVPASLSSSSTRPPRKKREPRLLLMKWDLNDWEKGLLGLIYSLSAAKVRIPWNEAARWVHPNCTGGALQQAIWKLRQRRLAQGKPVPPVFRMNWERAKPSVGGVSNNSNSGSENLHDGIEDGASAAPSSSPKSLSPPETPRRHRRGSVKRSAEKAQGKIRVNSSFSPRRLRPRKPASSSTLSEELIEPDNVGDKKSMIIKLSLSPENLRVLFVNASSGPPSDPSELHGSLPESGRSENNRSRSSHHSRASSGSVGNASDGGRSYPSNPNSSNHSRSSSEESFYYTDLPDTQGLLSSSAPGAVTPHNTPRDGGPGDLLVHYSFPMVPDYEQFSPSRDQHIHPPAAEQYGEGMNTYYEPIADSPVESVPASAHDHYEDAVLQHERLDNNEAAEVEPQRFVFPGLFQGNSGFYDRGNNRSINQGYDQPTLQDYGNQGFDPNLPTGNAFTQYQGQDPFTATAQLVNQDSNLNYPFLQPSAGFGDDFNATQYQPFTFHGVGLPVSAGQGELKVYEDEEEGDQEMMEEMESDEEGFGGDSPGGAPGSFGFQDHFHEGWNKENIAPA